MLPVYQRSYYNLNMADINNKPKIQLRPSLSINGEKTPSPSTKLLINHGKPNFTIQRSPKIQNGSDNPMSPPATPKNDFVVKSTTFNGVFKPSNISMATKKSLEENGNGGDNEAAKVVLRRTKVAEPPLKEGEDENVPEFIRRQRRIQERLAKENLDFENRRSGYFTHVVISPTSPNRKSFVETMSSPAIVPGLEIRPPVQPEKIVESEEEKNHEENKEELLNEIAHEIVQQGNGETAVAAAAPIALNGNHDEEEEVNKAIEEVNKAVAGEDDDRAVEEDATEETVVAVVTSAPLVEVETQEDAKAPVQAVVTSSLLEESQPSDETPAQVAVVTSALMEEPAAPVQAVVTSALMVEEEPQQNGHVEAVVHTEVHQQNGHSNDEITISHTNALDTPSLPSPDPSGEKGVNYEPKTVVSFSRDLGEPNKYPDTVKVVKDADTTDSANDELKELAKLKFEIKGDEQDIEVTPVLKVE
uniref:Uncharacterized protein n=2 Tax=Stomoxys calcitrans TaxID=35570 RepID=A0A1I8PE64_STOCA